MKYKNQFDKLTYKFTFLLTFFFFFYLFTPGQKKFSVTIQIPQKIDAKKLWITYDNGKEEIRIHNFLVRNNKIFISKPFFSTYAALILGYPIPGSANELRANSFFIKDKRAKILFPRKDSTQFPSGNYKLINTQTFETEKIALIKYDSIEVKEFDDYSSIEGDKIGNPSDTLANKVFNEKFKKISEKDLEFIYKNKDSYFYLWYFRTSIVRSNDISPYVLLHILDTIFTNQLKYPKDFNITRKILLDKINLTKKISPNFTCRDIKGNIISLSDYINKKFVIVVFWATSCKPCMEEIASLKYIQGKCLPQDLEIISISLDTNYPSFKKIIKEKKMDWINIYNDPDAVNAFGRSLPIPRTYLIDKLGNVVIDKMGYAHSDKQNDILMILKYNNILRAP